MPQNESSPPEAVVQLFEYLESPQASPEEREVVQAYVERLNLLKRYKDDTTVKEAVATFEMLATLKAINSEEPIVAFVQGINEQLDIAASHHNPVFKPAKDYEQAEKKALLKRSQYHIQSERAKIRDKGAKKNNNLAEQQALLAKLQQLKAQLEAKAQRRAEQKARLEEAQRKLAALKAKHSTNNAVKGKKVDTKPPEKRSKDRSSIKESTDWRSAANSLLNQSTFAKELATSPLGKDIQKRIEKITDQASYDSFRNDIDATQSNQALSFVQQGIDSLNERAKQRTTIGAGKKAKAIQTAVNNLTLAERATFPEPKDSPGVNAVLKAMDKKRVPNPFVTSARTMQQFKQKMMDFKANEPKPDQSDSHSPQGPR